ncbi:MAG TPA: hypothetical protein VK024_08370 [Actinomycetaceae bacterium]|nr:hypothetical protein [Actinomycetaceae bacterium]
MTEMRNTTFVILGMNTPDDARVVKDRLYHMGGLGGVATEIVPGGQSRIHLKHKSEITLDRALIEEVLRDAGDYRLA